MEEKKSMPGEKDLIQLRRLVKIREKELSLFRKISKALTSSLEFDRVLHLLMDHIQKMVSAENWSVLLLDQNARDLYFDLVKGRAPEETRSHRLRIGEGGAGWVAETGQPLIMTEVSKDPRFPEGIDRFTQREVHSVLYTPLINNKKIVGILEWINYKKGGSFTRKDLETVGLWTDLVTVVVERANLYQVMSNLAVTDDLTKLFNFRYLDQALESEIKRCRRYHSMVSVIFIDLDHFKMVNDKHGHLSGSKTLIEVAHILVENLRDVDIVARYGGDEFVIVLPYTPVDMAFNITQRLQRSIQKYSFLAGEGLNLKVTASFGIAGYPEHAENKTDLIRAADQAMYEAKNLGRDRIVMAEPLLSPAS
jgi:diguanylate cyclase (GGDEF)-like protein